MLSGFLCDIGIGQGQLSVERESPYILHLGISCGTFEGKCQSTAKLRAFVSLSTRACGVGVDELLPLELIASRAIGKAVLEDFIQVALHRCRHAEPEDGMVEDDDICPY